MDPFGSTIDSSGLYCLFANEARQANPRVAADFLPPGNLTDRVQINGGLAVAAGQGFTCVLTAAGTHCFGSNTLGQLAADVSSAFPTLRKPGSRPTPVAYAAAADITSISAGDSGPCFVFADGGVACAGEGARGRRGSGNLLDAGRALPGQELIATAPLIYLGGGVDVVVAVSAGLNNTCAITQTGALRCWGARELLGTPGDVGAAPGDLDALADATFPGVPAASKVVAVDVASAHACALFDSGECVCFGSNLHGRAGLGSLAEAPLYSAAPAPLVFAADGAAVKKVTVASLSTCVLFDTGRFRCFGRGPLVGSPSGADVGAADLDVETLGYISLPAGLPSRVLSVEPTSFGGCALTANFSLACWGYLGPRGSGPLVAPSNAVVTVLGSPSQTVYTYPLYAYRAVQSIEVQIGLYSGFKPVRNATLTCQDSDDVPSGPPIPVRAEQVSLISVRLDVPPNLDTYPGCSKVWRNPSFLYTFLMDTGAKLSTYAYTMDVDVVSIGPPVVPTTVIGQSLVFLGLSRTSTFVSTRAQRAAFSWAVAKCCFHIPNVPRPVRTNFTVSVDVDEPSFKGTESVGFCMAPAAELSALAPLRVNVSVSWDGLESSCWSTRALGVSIVLDFPVVRLMLPTTPDSASNLMHAVEDDVVRGPRREYRIDFRDPVDVAFWPTDPIPMYITYFPFSHGALPFALELDPAWLTIASDGASANFTWLQHTECDEEVEGSANVKVRMAVPGGLGSEQAFYYVDYYFLKGWENEEIAASTPFGVVEPASLYWDRLVIFYHFGSDWFASSEVESAPMYAGLQLSYRFLDLPMSNFQPYSVDLWQTPRVKFTSSLEPSRPPVIIPCELLQAQDRQTAHLLTEFNLYLNADDNVVSKFGTLSGRFALEVSLDEGFVWFPIEASFTRVTVTGLSPRLFAATPAGSAATGDSLSVRGTFLVGSSIGCVFFDSNSTVVSEADGDVVSEELMACPLPPVADPATLFFGIRMPPYLSPPEARLPLLVYTFPTVTAVLPAVVPAQTAAPVSITLFFHPPISERNRTVMDPACSFEGGLATSRGAFGATLGEMICRVPPLGNPGRYALFASLDGGVSTPPATSVSLITIGVDSVAPGFGPASSPTLLSVFGSFATGFSYECVFFSSFSLSAPGLPPAPPRAVASFFDSGQVRCLLPIAPVGTVTRVEIAVAGSPDSLVSSGGKHFRYLPDATLVALLPPSVAARGGVRVLAVPDTLATYLATGFALALVVRVSGVDLAGTLAFTSAGAPAVAFIAPAGVGLASVSLSFNGDAFSPASPAVQLLYYDVFQVRPSLAPLVGGAVLTLSGSGLAGNTSQVRCEVSGPGLNATRAQFTLIDSSTMSCVVPAAAAPGPALVRVSFNDEADFSAGVGFQFSEAVAVTALAPAFGPGAGLFPVTLFGSGFASNLSSLVLCRVNGLAGTVTATSPSQCVCVVPPGALSSAVEVATNGQDFMGAGSPAAVLTYYSAVAVSPLLAASSSGAGTQLTVTGSGFFSSVPYFCVFASAGGAVVSSSPATFVSSVTLRCPAPTVAALREGLLSVLDVAAPGPSLVRAAAAAAAAAGGSSFGLSISTDPSGAGGAALPPGSSGSPGVSLSLFELTVVSMNPVQGPAAGGTTVVLSVRGSGFSGAPASGWGCRFGQFGFTPASFSGAASTVSCVSPALQTGVYTVLLSPNGGADWIAPPAGVFFTTLPCPPGTFTLSYSEPCAPCEAGFYNDKPQRNGCLLCPPSQFQNSTGAIACLDCPAHTLVPVGAVGYNVTQCVCMPGYFSPSLTAGTPCQACPEGGTCPGGTSPPTPLSGFWSSRGDPYLFLKCKSAGCVGAANTGPEFCTGAYHERLCGGCVAGYYSSSNRCHACPSRAVTATLTAVFFLFIIVVSHLLLNLVSNSSALRSGATVGIIVVQGQVLAIIGDMEIGWDERILAVLRGLRVPFSLSIDTLGLECINPGLGYTTKWLLSMAIPLYFFAAIVAGGLLRFLVAHLRRSGPRPSRLADSLGQEVSADKALVSRVLNALVMIYSLTYLFMVKLAFSHFACTLHKDSVWSLNASPQLQCYVASWYRLVPVAVAGILYSTAVPLVLIVLVHRNKSLLRVPAFAARYASLYGQYASDRPLYEGVTVAEKLAIAFAALFLDNFVTFQINLLLIILMFGLILTFTFRPFWYRRDTHLSLTLRWCVFLVLCIAAVVRGGGWAKSAGAAGLVGFFFLIIAVLALTVSFVALVDVLALRRAKRTAVSTTLLQYLVRVAGVPHGKAMLVAWIEEGACSPTDQVALLHMLRLIDGITHAGANVSNLHVIPDRGTRALWTSAADVLTHRALSPKAVGRLGAWLWGSVLDPGAGRDIAALVHVSLAYSRWQALRLEATRTWLGWLGRSLGIPGLGRPRARPSKPAPDPELDDWTVSYILGEIYGFRGAALDRIKSRLMSSGDLGENHLLKSLHLLWLMSSKIASADHQALPAGSDRAGRKSKRTRQGRRRSGSRREHGASPALLVGTTTATSDKDHLIPPGSGSSWSFSPSSSRRSSSDSGDGARSESSVPARSDATSISSEGPLTVGLASPRIK